MEIKTASKGGTAGGEARVKGKGKGERGEEKGEMGGGRRWRTAVEGVRRALMLG